MRYMMIISAQRKSRREFSIFFCFSRFVSASTSGARGNAAAGGGAAVRADQQRQQVGSWDNENSTLLLPHLDRFHDA
jgi:hypothetical protein